MRFGMTRPLHYPGPRLDPSLQITDNKIARLNFVPDRVKNGFRTIICTHDLHPLQYLKLLEKLGRKCDIWIAQWAVCTWKWQRVCRQENGRSWLFRKLPENIEKWVVQGGGSTQLLPISLFLWPNRHWQKLAVIGKNHVSAPIQKFGCRKFCQLLYISIGIGSNLVEPPPLPRSGGEFTSTN